MMVAMHSRFLLEYCLTQEGQFRLHRQLGPHLSSTNSFEIVYKPLLVGDGSQLLPENPTFQLEYRNGLRAAEVYADDFEVDPPFLSFEVDPKFEAAVRE